MWSTRESKALQTDKQTQHGCHLLHVVVLCCDYLADSEDFIWLMNMSATSLSNIRTLSQSRFIVRPPGADICTWQYETKGFQKCILYTALNSPSLIFALWRSETDSPSLEFSKSTIFLHNPLYIIELDNAKHGIPSQGGKVDLDLWPRDSKSIGFLLSSSKTYMWTLKVIWQKL